MESDKGLKENTMEKQYKYLGVNDDKDFCELCGKTGLTKVVWLENTETGNIGHYGICCGAKLQKIATEEFKEWVKEEQEKIDTHNCFELTKDLIAGFAKNNFSETINAIIEKLSALNISKAFFNKRLSARNLLGRPIIWNGRKVYLKKI